MENKDIHETQPASLPPPLPVTDPHHAIKTPFPLPKSKLYLLLIFGFLLVALLMFGIRFYAEKNQQQLPNPTSFSTNPTSTPAPCTEENRVDSSCLKTYKNTDLGITFQYPHSELYELSEQTKTSVSFGQKETDGDRYITMLTISTDPTTFVNYSLLPPCKHLELMDENMIFPCISRAAETITLDQLPAKSFRVTYGNDNTEQIVQTTAKPKIELSLQTEGLDIEINQILSTFKFITPKITEEFPLKAYNGYSYKLEWQATDTTPSNQNPEGNLDEPIYLVKTKENTNEKISTKKLSLTLNFIDPKGHFTLLSTVPGSNKVFIEQLRDATDTPSQLLLNLETGKITPSSDWMIKSGFGCEQVPLKDNTQISLLYSCNIKETLQSFFVHNLATGQTKNVINLKQGETFACKINNGFYYPPTFIYTQTNNTLKINVCDENQKTLRTETVTF